MLWLLCALLILPHAVNSQGPAKLRGNLSLRNPISQEDLMAAVEKNCNCGIKSRVLPHKRYLSSVIHPFDHQMRNIRSTHTRRINIINRNYQVFWFQ
jgi:hypothetical protein